jgi:hypothetical protein
MTAPTVPAIGFSLADAEFRNGLPDQAALTRRIMSWQSWAHRRLTRATPADGGFWSTEWVSNGGFMTFYVPPPPVACRRLAVWVRARTMNGDVVVTVRSLRTGLVLTAITLSGASSGQWASGTVTVDAPDVVKVSVQCVPTDYVTAVSMWWDLEAEAPAGVTIEPTWPAALSQAYLAANRPDSAYVLRWIARRANQLLAHRSPMVVASVYPKAGAVIMLRISPRTPSLTIRAAGGGTSARLTYLSPALGTGTLYNGVGGADGWETITVPIQGHPQTAPIRAELFVSGSSLSAFSVFEDEPTAADLGLPGGETVPAAFIEPSVVLSGSPILANLDGAGGAGAGRLALLKNMIWLLAHKTRTLVCASARWSSGAQQRIYRVRTANDGLTKKIRIRVRSGPGVGYPSSTQKFGWGWLDNENGGGGGGGWVDLGLAPPVDSDAWRAFDANSLPPNSEWTYRRHWSNPSAEAFMAECGYGAAFEEIAE